MPINSDIFTRGRNAEMLMDMPGYKTLLAELDRRAFELWTGAAFGPTGEADRQQALALKLAGEMLAAVPQNWLSEARAVARMQEEIVQT